MTAIVDILNHQITWVIAFLGSWGIIGTIYHNYIVRKRLTEIRDEIKKMLR